MKPFRTACAVVAVLGALVSRPAFAEGISGRVMVKDRPAAGATVAAVPYETLRQEALREARREPPPPAAASTATAADGSFAMKLPPQPADRAYRLRVSGGGVVAGFVPGAWEPGECVDLGDLFAQKGEPLSGRIVLPAGLPAAEVEIVLDPAMSSRTELEPAPVTARPSADGRFSFDAAHPTSNGLGVRAEGFAVSPLSRQKAGPLDREICLQTALPVTGAVRKKDRETPAAGVLVRVDEEGARWVLTDGAGAFQVNPSPLARRLVADGGTEGIAEAPLRRDRSVAMALGPAASVVGRVVDRATGKALPGIRLAIEGTGRPTALRSGPDGTFREGGLPADRYSVEADDPRYVPVRRGRFAVAAGGTLKVDLVLVPGAAISGRVVDEKGDPVPGAKGFLVPAIVAGLRSLAGSGPPRAFATGKDGSFRASRLEPGENLRLVVRHPDFEEGAIGGLSVPSGSTRAGLRVVLRRAASVTGAVRDEKGAPIGGAEVWIGPTFESISVSGGSGPLASLVGMARPSYQRATAGADGRFEIRGLSPGKYTAGVAKPGYSTPAPAPLAIVQGAAARPLEFVLLPGASISGIVRYTDGTPAADKVVSGVIPNATPDGGGWGSSQPTGPDGAFTIPGLRVGVLYDLDLFEGRRGGNPRLRSVPSPSDGVEIVVPAPGRIAGTVADGGSRDPIPDFQVWFDRDRSSGQFSNLWNQGPRQGAPRGAGIFDRLTVRSEDGSFLLEEVPPGTWEVNVEAKGYQPSRIGGVIVGEGQTPAGLRIPMTRGATLHGSVVDAGSGRAVPEARISLTAGGGGPGAGLSSFSGEAASRGTDSDGLFEVEGLSPGKYSVTAGHADFSTATQSVEIPETGASVRLALHPGNGVSGQVLDENRRPVPGAAVSLTAGGQGSRNDQGTLADEGGRFRFDHVPAGRYSAAAARQRDVTKPVPVVVLDGQPTTDVIVVFAVGAVIKGTVTGLSPADLPGLSIFYRGGNGLAGNVKAGADGRFEIGGAGEGTYSLSGTLPRGGAGISRNVTREVVVAAGQTEVETELAFAPGGTISGTVTRGGSAVPGAFLVASQRGGSGTRNFATGSAGDDGTFRLSDLPNGSYSLSARVTQADMVGAQKTVELDGDAVVDLEIPTRAISGTVVEAGSGVPLVAAYVSASPVPPATGASQGAETDSTGTFSIGGLGAASWTVTASKRGFVFQKQTAALSSGDAADLRFEGTRAASILLHVLDGLLGIPLPSVVVRARKGDGTQVFGGTVPLDGEGRGEVPSTEAGSYSLEVRSNGYAPATLANVVVPSPPVEVRLTPGGTLEVRSGAKTLAKGTVTAKVADGSGAPYPVTAYSDGKISIPSPLVRFENVAPGSYTLTVAGVEPQPFRIAEGGAAVVTLP